MEYLLSPAAREVLTRLTRERTLYAFDFDGTLSPIVDHPGHARIPRRTRELLGRLAAMFPCIVVSGRARSDVMARLEGLQFAHVVGNHGAEDGTVRTPCRHVERWKKELETELDGMPGVWVEDKCLSLAVHYRHSPSPGAARRRILAATGKLQNVHIFGGKEVVNVVPPDAPLKGAALAAERARLGCDWVLYVGDDENDEDAFALSGNVVPVRIGRKKDSKARYYLHTQGEIDKLLQFLLAEAERGDGPVRKPAPSSRVKLVDRR